MNTLPPFTHSTTIIDSHGNIGEIVMRADKIIRHDKIYSDLISTGHRIEERRHTGQWLLIVGPRNIRTMMTNVIVGIGQHEEVRVLDCGNQYDSLLATHLVRNDKGVAERIKIKHVSSPAEVLYLLDNTSMVPVPFVLLDLLRPFYDTTVPLAKRKDMLIGCLQNIRRLQIQTGGMVSVCPQNRTDGKEGKELFGVIQEEAKKTFDIEVLYPGWNMKRLF